MRQADRLNATFAALADPTRRAILARLASGHATVNEIAEPFAMTQPAVSKHLKVLERAGLISRIATRSGGPAGSSPGGWRRPARGSTSIAGSGKRPLPAWTPFWRSCPARNQEARKRLADDERNASCCSFQKASTSRPPPTARLRSRAISTPPAGWSSMPSPSRTWCADGFSARMVGPCRSAKSTSGSAAATATCGARKRPERTWAWAACSARSSVPKSWSPPRSSMMPGIPARP